MTTATIDNTGLATALAGGTTNISAVLDGVTSPNAVLTVGGSVVTGLNVTPASPTLAVGNTTNLVALELLSNGTTQPLTGTVTWAVSGCTPAGSSTIASTTTNGTEIAIGDLAGACTVTATEGALTGTSAVTVVAGSAHFAYISNSGDSTISQYAVNAASTTAPLTPLTPPTVPINTPVQLVINPNGKFVYAIDSSSTISQFDVDPGGSGTLTLDPHATFVVGGSGTGANFMVIDPSGRFMYVSDDATSTIDGFTIDPVTGFLTPIAAVTGYTNGTLQAPEDLLVDRSDQYLYASNSAGNTVSGFAIGPTGALTPLVPATNPTGATPLLGTIDAANNMYIADSGDNTVAAFSINSTTGALGVLASVTVTTATSISNAVVDPTSKYLYVLDSGTGSAAGNVYGYTLATTGGVGAVIPVTPVATGINPIGITIDPSGTLLAVDNNNDSTITPYGVVTTTGTPTAEPNANTGLGPLFLVFYNAP
jgi:6-phosphogluconolactonase (cycloisomerase 2 family)